MGKKVFVFDISRCSGCYVCQTACKDEHCDNDWTPIAKPQPDIGQFWIKVHDYPRGTAPKVRVHYVPEMCNHCDKPPCVRVCPTKATFKNADGIVVMDFHRCIGCRFCMAACPYGSRSFNWRDPRDFIDQAQMNRDFPTRTRGVVEKCNFCAERLRNGLQPACVEACKGNGAIVFGDLNDSNSELRRLLKENHTVQRNPSLGTHPSVFYIV